MTTSHDITGLPSTTINVVLPKFDASTLKLTDVTIGKDGRSASADYVLPAGDQNYPVTVNIRINQTAPKVGQVGKTSYSIRLNAWELTSVDSEVIASDAIDALIALNVPSNTVRDIDKSMVMAGLVFHLLCGNATADAAPETDRLTELAFGIADILT